MGKITRRDVIRSVLGAAGSALLPRQLWTTTAAQLGGIKGAQPVMRPHLLVTAEKVAGLRSLEELRESATRGHGRVLWDEVKKRADADLQAAPLAGGSRAYPIVNATAKRIMRSALAFLITQRERYRDAAAAQINATLDPTLWPNWRDEAHPAHMHAGLRMGQLGFAFGLAYDWLYTALTAEERHRMVDGFRRLAVEPVLKSVEMGQWHVGCLSNLLTCILGGTGVAAMAMGEALPESEQLLDVAKTRLKAYLRVFGPNGEWNESIPYAVSVIYPVTFFSALRYWSAIHEGEPRENIIGAHPFTSYCVWAMYMTRPHAREAPLGDGIGPRRISLSYVPAVAAAARDGVLQWYYLNNLASAEETEDVRNYPLELIFYDHTLKPVSPEGRLPHGRAFPANTMCVSSRTDWNPRSTPCMVYGKGGAAYEVHGHHDVGQVCIDGYGEPLLIDLAGYASDLGGKEICGSAAGHNVLIFDRQDMRTDRPISRAMWNAPERRESPPLRANFIDYSFDDERGGYWVLDTTDVYDGVRAVLRTVVHLNPGVVAVLDTATLPKARDVSLRWHTVDKCEPDLDGRFLVEGANGVHLASRVVRVDDGPIAIARGEHEEIGKSFVEAALHGRRCTLLSLFCVFGPGQEPRPWNGSGGAWSIKGPAGVVNVNVSSLALSVAYQDGRFGWRIRRYRHRPR